MRFADPLLLALLLVPAAIALAAWRRGRRPPAHLGLPTFDFLADLAPSRRERWRRRLPAARALGLGLVAFALARPQVSTEVREVKLRSRNIMVALDISSSMKATDFQPGNRLEVARKTLADFVSHRPDDLVGLVIFAGRAFLQAPLTPDTDILQESIKQVDIGMLPDGTAIGTALAMCLNQLKDMPVKASTIVLITDGANNTGSPTPYVAAEAARALGIRVHAIGLSSADTTKLDENFVWRWGRAPERLTRWDEAVLKKITSRTGGAYYRATDPAALSRVLDQIDRAERTDVRVSETREYRELYPFMLVPALLLLTAELALGATWLRALP